MFDNKAYMKEYHQRPGMKAREKERREKRRDKIDDLLGNLCAFCGRTRRDARLTYHKKDGQPHDSEAIYLVEKNPDDWGLVCRYPCHSGVHWCLEVWGLSWDETVEVYKANSKFGEKIASPVVEDSNHNEEASLALNSLF